MALAVAAHGAAGGGMPSLGLPIVAAVLLAGLATGLAQRQRGPVAILLVLGPAQFGMHLLLECGGAGNDQPARQPFDPLLMTGLHIAATTATALLMAEAERAVFAVVDAARWLVHAALAVLCSLPMPDRVRRLPGVPSAGFTVVDSCLIRVRPSRGPPVLMF
jgi:hypothetical protein